MAVNILFIFLVHVNVSLNYSVTYKELLCILMYLLLDMQVLIFPEGTCTNRSCLITFKPGAFYPGVPIQPVCIRYPNKLDTVTWTWEGPGA
jgi:hypothetical protein